MYGRDIPIVVAIDSRSLFELIIGLNSKIEKQLLIYLTCLRKADELRELGEIILVKSEDTPSDGLTKPGECMALQRLINENKINFEPTSLVERKGCIWEDKLQQKRKIPSFGLIRKHREIVPDKIS